MGNGLLEVSHNGLAMLGLAVLVVTVFVAGTRRPAAPDRGLGLDWLQERSEARAEASDDITVAAAEPDGREPCHRRQPEPN